uniref:Potassium calcium-activated channel subfamily M regulatory beta subunit 3 n=1 Tax=Latimeria chalumnae TaxID=7897 RepID=H3B6J3_LATCH
RQSFSVPIQITLQHSRRRQMRKSFPAVATKSFRNDDNGKGPEKNKTQDSVSNAGEDRAMLLGFTMMGFSVMMYFLLGITVLKPFIFSSYTSVQIVCTVLQTGIMYHVLQASVLCSLFFNGQSGYLQLLQRILHFFKIAILHSPLQLNSKCFYIPKCLRDKNELLNTALNIKHTFDQGNGNPFSCYYNPDTKPEDVILIKKYDNIIVFHCLFWPTLMLLGGVIIVSMVKLTQHLSRLCERYSNKSKEE